MDKIKYKIKRFIAEIQYCFINHWRDYLDYKRMKDTIIESNGVEYKYDNEYMVDYNPFHYKEWKERMKRNND